MDKTLGLIIHWIKNKATEEDIIAITEAFESRTFQSNIDQALIRLIKESKALEAVKLYKDFAGLGLKEAKDYVDDLRSKLSYDLTNPTFIPASQGILSQIKATPATYPGSSSDMLDLLKQKFGK